MPNLDDNSDAKPWLFNSDAFFFFLPTYLLTTHKQVVSRLVVKTTLTYLSIYIYINHLVT